MISVDLAYVLLMVAGCFVLLYGFARSGALLIVWAFTFLPIAITAAHSRAHTWSQVPDHLEDALLLDGYLLLSTIGLELIGQLLVRPKGQPRNPQRPHRRLNDGAPGRL